MENGIGIVLIHGAGLGTHIWDEVDRDLDYPVLRIQYPNRKSDSGSKNSFPLEEYLNSAIHQIEEWQQDHFVVVAHSIGGCIGLMLNDHFGSGVKGFIGISAIIAKSGSSFTDSFSFPQKFIVPLLLKLFGTKPPEKSIASELCNDLDTQQSEQIVRQFSPESVQLYTDKVMYSALPSESLYVKLTNDKAVSEKMQDEMIHNLQCEQVVEMDSGHLPMISKPKKLTETIFRFVQKVSLGN